MAQVSIPNPIVEAIDQAYQDTQEPPRGHLGASMLGHPCDRWLWLSFRWAVVEKFSGRILRLFRRGQDEEARIVGDLCRIGVQFRDTKGEQVRVDFGSHVSGSVDAIIESGLPGAPKAKHVVEMKTHSLKSFNDLCSKGVQQSKPMHWAQMQVYMHGLGIHRALYYAICKDDDRIYTERLHYDNQAAEKLVDKGRRIAQADRMPEPLSSDPTWWECKFCAAHEFCHKTKKTREVNCRTCAHSTASVSGHWGCAKWGNDIPLDFQRSGCSSHVVHPDLVPWKLDGSDGNGWRAVYLVDGRKVVNGEPGPGVVSSAELLGISDES